MFLVPRCFAFSIVALHSYFILIFSKVIISSSLFRLFCHVFVAENSMPKLTAGDVLPNYVCLHLIAPNCAAYRYTITSGIGE